MRVTQVAGERQYVERFPFSRQIGHDISNGAGQNLPIIVLLQILKRLLLRIGADVMAERRALSQECLPEHGYHSPSVQRILDDVAGQTGFSPISPKSI